MNDLTALAALFYRAGNRTHDALCDGVEKTARRVKINAQNRLGHYQDGWKVLKAATVRAKLNKNKSAKKRAIKKGTYGATGTDSDAPLVDEGHLRASITISMDRHHIKAEVGSPLIYHATHEMGDEERHIPERPHLRPALQEEVASHLMEDLKEALSRRFR
ncbi:hypothetical protein EEL32_25570 [Brevibacillus laterosporus]|nr:hypothetical protein [Brevibacillus laterosporus]TPG74029.1 hypothetical protein EEL32_25570 [Brevibacillus laterosporus]